MFTEADLQDLVPSKIFDRGAAYYYEDDAVGRIKQKGNVFKAKVIGTDTYRVELTVHPAGPPEIYCDCPYDHGDVCKHGIALGLAVLDLLGEDEPQPTAALSTPAPPAQPTTQQLRQALKAAWARTSDKEKMAYLGQLLYQQPALIPEFLNAFEFSLELLLAADPTPKPKFKSKPAAPRRPPTLNEQAHALLDQQRGAELLPLLLTLDWLREPPAWDAHTLPHLLTKAAEFQPEATLDAVMERFETHLENKAQRSALLYSRLSACLSALAKIPALTKQVQLFASELIQHHHRLQVLRESLERAGFILILPVEDTGLPLKRRGRKSKPATAKK